MIREPKDINENTPWQEMTVGGEIACPGTSKYTMTGEWRSDRPVWTEDKCRQCLLCALYCPDSSIPVDNKKRADFDYDHCKGCGICSNVCPFGAIGMIREGEQS